MDDRVFLSQLEELAGKLAIEVRYENIAIEESSSAGGLCRVNGQYTLIIHSPLTVKEKIGIIVAALKGFDIEHLYVRPVIRELLDNMDTQ